MPDPVISVKNVSKAYRIWESPAARILSPLQASLGLKARAAKSYRDFWALKDVSFEVQQGEAVGIIGRNGSGKSTLLQIIAGTLQPTEGEVNVNGRVAALLELGSGFNPDFTGRENVHLLGAIRGLTREQIDARFDAIAAFADIGDFIEQPVKTYSSGMAVRLAFAVCAHVDANVLIIDEALGVGDARFQLKCARTIDRFIEEGRTLIFVSHDLNSVNRLCNAGILLEQGRLQLLHSPRTITNIYTKMMTDDRGLASITTDLEKARETSFERGRQEEKPKKNMETTVRPEIDRSQELSESEIESASEETSDREFSMGDGGVVIEKIEVLDSAGQPRRAFQTCEKIEIRAYIRAKRDIPHPIFACRLRNAKGMNIYGTNTYFLKIPTVDLCAGKQVEVTYIMTLNLLAGPYFVSCSCSHFEGNKNVIHHRRYDSLEINIHQHDSTFGIANCQATISARPLF